MTTLLELCRSSFGVVGAPLANDNVGRVLVLVVAVSTPS